VNTATIVDIGLSIRRTGDATTPRRRHDPENVRQCAREGLKTSTDFFRQLDFQLNAQFTDDAAACMIVSEGIYVMLLTEDKFKAVTPKQISDATNFRAITGTWRSFVIRIWTI